MLRALAQLGVVHQPDFDPAWAMAIPADAIDQLSRSGHSLTTLERYGGSLTIANLGNLADLDVETVHGVRTGGHGLEILMKVAEIRGERAQARSDRS